MIKGLGHVRRPAARGAASLAVVMVLFFILAMVAAYTNRNLIFEQRTSANSYRSARSIAAADAGVDWVIGMLNGGAIGPACNATGASDDFRTRYLKLQPDGRFKPATWPTIWPGITPPQIQAQPACVADGAGWSCSCPLNGPPGQLSETHASAPAFTVSFSDAAGPGIALVRVRGCSTLRTGELTSANVNAYRSCHVNDMTENVGYPASQLSVDSMSVIRVSLGLVSALPVAPSAALTVKGAVNQSAVGGTELRAVNADPSTGLALRAGEAIGDPSVVKAAGPAGSTSSAAIADDVDLKTVAAADLFRQTFGLPAEHYQQQPAARLIDCTGGCGSSAILPVVASNPTRVIFVNGDLTLDDAAPIGTPTVPTLLVVTGNVSVTSAVTFHGVIYAGGSLTWAAGAGGGRVNGAVIVGGDFNGFGHSAFFYDRDVVRRIHKGYGSFVRVPGSWMTET